MQPWMLILLIVPLMDAFIVWALFKGFVVGTWHPLAKQFPPRAPTLPSVTRDFQSFAFGIFNMGFCVHVEADESCLHLRPAAILRWFGATTMSIPWEQVSLREAPRDKGQLKARLGRQHIKGPAWCLRLANAP